MDPPTLFRRWSCEHTPFYMGMEGPVEPETIQWIPSLGPWYCGTCDRSSGLAEKAHDISWDWHKLWHNVWILWSYFGVVELRGQCKYSNIPYMECLGMGCPWFSQCLSRSARPWTFPRGSGIGSRHDERLRWQGRGLMLDCRRISNK